MVGGSVCFDDSQPNGKTTRNLICQIPIGHGPSKKQFRGWLDPRRHLERQEDTYGASNWRWHRCCGLLRGDCALRASGFEAYRICRGIGVFSPNDIKRLENAPPASTASQQLEAVGKPGATAEP